MEDRTTPTVTSFLIELIVYAGLVVAYVFLVLAVLGSWLQGMYEHNKTRYAVIALLLIIGQGVALEVVTSALLKLVRSRTD